MNSLQEFGELFKNLDLTELEIEEGNFKLKLKRDVKEKAVSVPVSDRLSPVKQEEPVKEAGSTTGNDVNAPLLGIFYLIGEADKKASVGKKVKAGDVLCTIEAMKMMNEVKAPMDGEIREICAKDGDLVEFGQKLFVIV